jgi:hypothetical protein
MRAPLNKAHARLRVLRYAGLVDHRRVLHQEPGVYWAMRKGLLLSGLDLPVASVSLASYRHSLAVVDAAFHYETQVAVLTERELRRGEREGEHRFQIQAGVVAHRPDFVALLATGPIAFEVELSGKGLRRLDAILTGYQLAIAEGNLLRVVYLVPDTQAAGRLAERRSSLYLSEDQLRIRLIGDGR